MAATIFGLCMMALYAIAWVGVISLIIGTARERYYDLTGASVAMAVVLIAIPAWILSH